MKRGVLAAIAATTMFAAAVLAWSAVSQEREFRSLVALGDEALVRGQTFEAIEAFSGAIALKGDSMVAHLKRGESYLRRGELGSALRDAREAAELDPTAPRPAELLGDVNAAMGRHERATEHYRRFLTLDERSPRVLYKLGLAYYRDGQAPNAVDPLRRAVGLDERMAEAHHLLGVCLREERRLTEAVSSLQHAIELSPALAIARAELADVFGELGRGRERIDQLEALAALEPERPARMISVALAYAAVGRSEAALATLARAADRHPDDPAVSTAIGRVWLDAGNVNPDPLSVAKALEALRPAATKPTASSETLALYGRALLLSGEVDAAELVLQQAVSRTPIHPLALLYLADTADRLSHTRVANDARRRYAALAGR